ncbi:MAG: hypothetical protein M0Q87_02960, partial [Ottowia sp.]|nr:hypothetical protein [Ottowia sp.]
MKVWRQVFSVQRVPTTLNLPIMAAQPQSLPPHSGAVIVMGAQRSTFNAQRSTFNAQRSTLNAQRSTLNAQRSTLNAQRSTPNA